MILKQNQGKNMSFYLSKFGEIIYGIINAYFQKIINICIVRVNVD